MDAAGVAELLRFAGMAAGMKAEAAAQPEPRRKGAPRRTVYQGAVKKQRSRPSPKKRVRREA